MGVGCTVGTFDLADGTHERVRHGDEWTNHTALLRLATTAASPLGSSITTSAMRSPARDAAIRRSSASAGRAQTHRPRRSRLGRGCGSAPTVGSMSSTSARTTWSTTRCGRRTWLACSASAASSGASGASCARMTSPTRRSTAMTRAHGCVRAWEVEAPGCQRPSTAASSGSGQPPCRACPRWSPLRARRPARSVHGDGLAGRTPSRWCSERAASASTVQPRGDVSSPPSPAPPARAVTGCRRASSLAAARVGCPCLG